MTSICVVNKNNTQSSIPISICIYYLPGYFFLPRTLVNLSCPYMHVGCGILEAVNINNAHTEEKQHHFVGTLVCCCYPQKQMKFSMRWTFPPQNSHKSVRHNQLLGHPSLDDQTHNIQIH